MTVIFSTFPVSEGDNLDKKQDKLVGTVGQVIGFDESGNAVASNDVAELQAALSKRPTVEEVAAMIDEKIAAHNRSEESHPTFLSVGEMEETNGAET